MNNELSMFEGPDAIQKTLRYAEAIANTEAIPQGLRGKPASILTVLFAGHELGMKPQQAIRQLGMINGKLAISAERLRALALKHPECRYFVCIEATDTTCTWETKRGEGPVQRCTWTIEYARRAGLADKDGYKKYPRQYLKARASAELYRDAYPDADGGYGIYAREELDGIDEPVEPITSKQSIIESLQAKHRVVDAQKPSPPIIDAPRATPERLNKTQSLAQISQHPEVQKLVSAVGGKVSVEGDEYVMATSVKKGTAVSKLDDGALKFYANGKGSDAEAAKSELMKRGVA